MAVYLQPTAIETKTSRPLKTSKSKVSAATKERFQTFENHMKVAFNSLSEHQTSQLCLVLSCVLNSKRPLHISEVAALLDLGHTTGLESDHFEDVDEIECAWLPMNLRPLINFDQMSRLRFVRLDFKIYLESRPLMGIDRSQLAITQKCLLRIERMLDMELLSKQAPVTDEFSKYAEDYWLDHYRAVQDTHHGLVQNVHRIMRGHLKQERRARSTEVVNPQYESLKVDLDTYVCLENRAETAGLTVLGQVYRRVLDQFSSGLPNQETDEDETLAHLFDRACKVETDNGESIREYGRTSGEA